MGEKRYPPTKRRIERARREGKVLKSQLLSQALGAAAVTSLLAAGAGRVWVSHALLLEYNAWESLESAAHRAISAAASGALIAGGILTAHALTALAGELFQAGCAFDAGATAPKLQRIEPFAGLKKIVSSAAKSWSIVVKAMVIATACGCAIRLWMTLCSGGSTLEALLPAADDALGAVLVSGTLLLVSLGAFDLFLKRAEFLKELRMSREELLEELRNEEGDPHVRAARRAEHEALIGAALIRRVRGSKFVAVAPSGRADGGWNR